jgi:hypothetical protein
VTAGRDENEEREEQRQEWAQGTHAGDRSPARPA